MLTHWGDQTYFFDGNSTDSTVWSKSWDKGTIKCASQHILPRSSYRQTRRCRVTTNTSDTKHRINKHRLMQIHGTLHTITAEKNRWLYWAISQHLKWQTSEHWICARITLQRWYGLQSGAVFSLAAKSHAALSESGRRWPPRLLTPASW